MEDTLGTPEDYDECVVARDHPVEGFTCTYYYQDPGDGTDARVLAYEEDSEGATWHAWAWIANVL